MDPSQGAGTWDQGPDPGSSAIRVHVWAFSAPGMDLVSLQLRGGALHPDATFLPPSSSPAEEEH